MIGEMLKSTWSDFDWKGKLFVAAIPLFLLLYAVADFAPPNCDYERGNYTLASKPDNPYRANGMDSWGRALQNCEASLVARQHRSSAEQAYWAPLQANARDSYTNVWLIGLFVLLPLGVVLSYANAAGRWGNGAYVKWSDFYGIPLVFFFSGWLFFHGTIGTSLLQTGAVTAQASQALLIGSALIGIFFGLPWMFVFGAEFLQELWTTFKGLFILIHYMFTSHPAEIHIPAHPDTPISRQSLREAITTHYAATATATSTGGFWSMFKPRFMYEHELFRANKVEELLRADTSILQEAIRRERARAEAGDLKKA